jgi:hypothetical protein
VQAFKEAKRLVQQQGILGRIHKQISPIFLSSAFCQMIAGIQGCEAGNMLVRGY